MSSNRTSSASVDNLVFDFYTSASEAILQDRRSITNPITNGNVAFANNAEFCRHSLDPWKKDLSKTLIFDLYIFDPKMNKHILMERWKFHYQRNTEMKDARQLNIISRRVLTLVRSLYCFVRMMPGFNLINISAKPPTLSFQLYEQKSTYPTSFVHEISRYDFHPVSTSKGAITVSVRFITSHSVKEILTTVNGGSGPPGGHSRRNSRTAEENGSTAAIPIPTDHGHGHGHSANHEDREHGGNGKYPNSRSAGPSSLDATDNSSYSSTGTAGSQGIPIPPGSTPPLGGNRFARSSRERDPHRRSFQLPPHAEHGGDGYYSGGGSYEIEEAVRHLNQGGAGSGHGSARGESQSHSGHSSQGHTPQQAGSLDSYANAQQHMHRLSVDSTGSGPRTGSQRTSPQHYQGQGPGQAQSLGTDTSNTPFPPPGGYGNKTNSGSYGTGAGTSYGTTAGTSYGNSYSLQSTPPFLLGEIAGRQGDRYSGNYPDLAQGESPPYPAFSSSLTSTSPHLAGSNVTMMALIEQRARTHSHGGGGGSGYGSGHGDEHRGFVFNNGIKSGRISPTSGMDFSDLKLNITPLPSSPFVHLSRGSFSEDGSRNALVPAFTPQNPQHRSSVSVGSLGRSLAGLSPAAPGDNTLDSIRMQQSQRTRLDSADGADLALFTASGDGPSTGGARQLSRDRERSSTTSRTEERDSFDLHELDEDMPFAWAEADGGLSSASLMMGPAVDSVGAQLLHGLSIHSGGQAHGGYGSDRQYDSYQYGDPNRGRNERNMSNSTYTAAGLSGELMGKINDFKNLSSTFASK